MQSESPEDVINPQAVCILALYNPGRVFLSLSHSESISIFSIIIDCIKLVRPPLSKRTPNLELEEHPAEIVKGMVLSTAEILVTTESVDVVESLLKATLAQDVVNRHNESFLAFDVGDPHSKDIALV